MAAGVQVDGCWFGRETKGTKQQKFEQIYRRMVVALFGEVDLAFKTKQSGHDPFYRQRGCTAGRELRFNKKPCPLCCYAIAQPERELHRVGKKGPGSGVVKILGL